MTLRAPFPWNGGKSRVAEIAWRGFGPDVVNYVEPFFGSGAMLLGRPRGAGKIETVNDIDGGICNFYRAIQSAPDEVAKWCDWPVSELDLHARHAWLVERLEEMADQLRADPHYFDAKVAGWWVHGICQWIGTGWCDVSKLTRSANQRPHVSGDNVGMGVLSQQMPSLRVDSGASGNGVLASALARKMPPGEGTSSETGRGALSESAQENFGGLPAIGNDRGINGVAAPPCTAWFRALRDRLRRVRIVCGDWTRVLGPSVLGKGKNVGGRRPCAVFLDPPYDLSLRARRIYSHDADGLAMEVRRWAIEHGDDPDLRVALCGYESDSYAMPASWAVYAWKGARGYAGEDNDNRERERIWFSPHCLPIDQPTLFGRMDAHA